MMMTMLLCLTVLVGTNGELWRLMSMVKISAQLPVALGVVVSISHFVLLPIGGSALCELAAVVHSSGAQQ
jgi:hypothetical protein